MRLNEVNVGEKVIVESIDLPYPLTLRLIQMGFYNGSEVEVVIIGINKHLKAYRVNGTLVALRDKTAEKIKVNYSLER